MVMIATRSPTVEGQVPHAHSFRLYATRMSEERTLFTVAEAAAQLGISPETLRTAARVGKLAVVRVNPRLNMVTSAAIEAYRRDHLGRVGRPSRAKKGRKTATPRAGGGHATHDAIDEGPTTPPHE